MQSVSTIKRASRSKPSAELTAGAKRCRRKFLRIFPKGFQDETYVAWERDYKWQAHLQWKSLLDPATFQSLLKKGEFAEIASRAIRIESRTNLLFSFEKMALRDSVKIRPGARLFSEGLYDLLYGQRTMADRFSRWCATVAELPRKQTRVLTWPIVTVFGFIAEPRTHFFLKPNVTRRAAQEYGFPFEYKSKPSWTTYANLLEFAFAVRRDLTDLRPRDMIDLQSFVWVQGSDEYD
jgi:hypothetical protein